VEETTYRHISVLTKEVLTYLDPQPDKLYIDATFGGGGHTRAILEREPEARVVAIDWDQNALELRGAQLQEEFPDRLQLVWGNFANLYKLLKENDIDQVAGILADIGTSQYQITERAGFSFLKDTPLDMRMSPAHQKVTAAEIINKASEEKLRQIFWQLGEESQAKKIVQAITDARRKNTIATTGQLASIIERVIPAGGKRTHPATKVFQALRIYINHELDNLQAFLPAAVRALVPEGRLVVISFHSLEDRIVKQYFNSAESAGELTILTPQPVSASDEEIIHNPSARSARLRAAKKV
jgi:16S rRNA (cytosine1402-N4)-methyltransferase